MTVFKVCPVKILILEDDQERIDAFTDALAIFAELELHIWKDAHGFIQEVDRYLDGADLISLDHDLVSEMGDDPGDGLQVAEYLRDKEPVCPILIHSTNVDRSWSMLRELEDGGWQVERRPPIGMGTDWIQKHWIVTVKDKLGQ